MEPKANPLREWRRSRGLSAVDVALKLDLSEQTILSYETGRFEPSRESVEKLCELMGLSEAQLRLRWHFWKSSKLEEGK